MKLFNFFRRTKTETLYPNRYLVRVSISHPRIIGHITTVHVTIDAYNKHHARRQLRNQLKLTVGKVMHAT